MNSHVVLIAGAAGSGKDTVAGIVCKNFNALSIAQADPMKRFVRNLFEFSLEQLWGPSERRNEVDPRLEEGKTWDSGWEYINSMGCRYWLKNMLKQGRSDMDPIKAHDLLVEWYKDAQARQLKTPRAILQTFGTEYGRSLHEDVWSNIAMNIARTLLRGGVSYQSNSGTVLSPESNPSLVLVTDGRFKNEVLNIQAQNGVTVLVTDPRRHATETDAVEKAGIKGHASEAELNGMPDHFFNVIISNDKTRGLDALESMVKMCFKSFLLPQYWS